MLFLRFTRLEKRITQYELAHLSKVPQGAISCIETGRLNPTADELERLARVLGVNPPDRLMLSVVEPEDVVPMVQQAAVEA